MGLSVLAAFAVKIQKEREIIKGVWHCSRRNPPKRYKETSLGLTFTLYLIQKTG
jgi:hypothetical protein